VKIDSARKNEYFSINCATLFIFKALALSMPTTSLASTASGILYFFEIKAEAKGNRHSFHI
jgi:hypothetical protein